MCLKLLLLTAAAVLQFPAIYGQRQWVPPTTTAAEMWNPYTWYWPYAIAASEGYRQYYQNAQQITNQLYQQAYATNAFWWTYRPGGGGGNNTVAQAGGAAGQATGQATGQAGQTTGQATGQAGQATGGTQPVANMAQGGSGWN